MGKYRKKISIIVLILIAGITNSWASNPYIQPLPDVPHDVATLEALISQHKTMMEVMQDKIDMSIAQENIWLETDSLGFGGVWLGIAPDRERMDKVAGILDLPDNVEAFSIFVLGYPAGAKKAQENRFDENRIHYVV